MTSNDRVVGHVLTTVSREYSTNLSWRAYTDWAKKRPLTLQLADVLGRGRGRMRMFDHVNAAARAALQAEPFELGTARARRGMDRPCNRVAAIDGMTVLTDPVMSNRIGIGFGLVTGGPRRHVAAALSVRNFRRSI